MGRFTVDDANEAIAQEKRGRVCLMGAYCRDELIDDEERTALEMMARSGLGAERIMDRLAGWGVPIAFSSSTVKAHFGGQCSCPDDTPLLGVKKRGQ